MTLNVVGISGKAGTGKDFLATTVFAPAGFKPWSLAWHFKIWLVGQGKATFEEVFDTKPPHVRKLLQQEGTELGRNVYGENIWCDTTAAWITLMARMWSVENIVIPDVRFPNEVAMVHRLGGKVVRVHAPARAAAASLSAEAREHPSETALDDFTGFDLVVQNDPYESMPLWIQCLPVMPHKTDPTVVEACAPAPMTPEQRALLGEMSRLNQELGEYR